MIRTLLRSASQQSTDRPRLPRMIRRIKVGALPGTSDDNSRATTPSLDHLSEHYTRSELEEYRQLFLMFDTDNSGSISNEELKAAVISIGLQLTDEEVDDLIKEVDEDQNGVIDFSEFCHCLKRSQNIIKSSNDEMVRKCFEIFDQDQNGFISANEFIYIAKELGGFTNELAEFVFEQLDVSSNGQLNIQQLSAIIDDYLLSDQTTRIFEHEK
ncbi:putative calcium-binding protein [Aphelenchoides bicaudatus]|nr:putative calcium-binding protein [Aphelenchoides bicaudatus]